MPSMLVNSTTVTITGTLAAGLKAQWREEQQMIILKQLSLSSWRSAESSEQGSVLLLPYKLNIYSC
jgi:hypothetical protein